MLELLKIQQKLKAPKNQRNNFGNYNYRNCEDILEAVKPLLEEMQCALVFNDEVISIDNNYSYENSDSKIISDKRVYIKAIATLINSKGDEISASSYARESAIKKGMDESQITGATSSYARKYALNALFCIDDSRDADSHENSDCQKISKPTQAQTSSATTNTSNIPYLNKYASLKDKEAGKTSDIWLKMVDALCSDQTTILKIKEKFRISATSEAELKDDVIKKNTKPTPASQSNSQQVSTTLF